MFLYHINVGWPLLDQGTRFEAPIAGTPWRSDSVAEQGVSHLLFPGPQAGFVEQVYEHTLTPDADGSMIWLEHGDQRGYDTTFRFSRQ